MSTSLSLKFRIHVFINKIIINAILIKLLLLPYGNDNNTFYGGSCVKFTYITVNKDCTKRLVPFDNLSL